MQRLMQYTALALSFAALFSSCIFFKKQDFKRGHELERMVRHSQVFQNSFSGFVLFDPERNRTLSTVNGNHYFIPASNVKLLTLAACLKYMGDSLPRFNYRYYPPANGTAGKYLIQGAGDPSFLHPEFQAWQPRPEGLFQDTNALRFFTRTPDFLQQPRWGRGWAWDDFAENYSCEITSMPLYGNRTKVFANGRTHFLPAQEQDSLRILGSLTRSRRSALSGIYYLSPSDSTASGRSFPMFDEEHSVVDLINDTLHLHWKDYQESTKNIDYQSFRALGVTPAALPETDMAEPSWQQWRVTPIDTVLRKMMVHSDNFIAEQLLLAAAGTHLHWLSQDSMIRFMLDSALHFLPQRPKWVDGSGLSRYNLLSPESITVLLNDLWAHTEHGRLLALFPKGGLEGTLAEYYSGSNGESYLFAKSGSMSGVQCLSGFIRCKSGKVLIFSFMHNNFVGSGKPWKIEMQRILEWTRDHY